MIERIGEVSAPQKKGRDGCGVNCYEEDSMADERKLVIVGGVAGGTAAASRARRIDKGLKIDIYEKGPYISYSA